MVILKVIVLTLALTSNILAEDCFLAPGAEDYRGTISVTKTGRTCQKWTAQSPQAHGYTPTAYPSSGLGDHNYCRNPSGDPETWCYTTDLLKRWEYCDVEEFRCESECYNQGNAADYRGVVSYTETGKECQKWTSQSPQSHGYTPAAYPTSGLGDHNYCRNPSDDPKTWCYTTDPGVRWQYCSISAVGTACPTTTEGVDMSCFTDLKAKDYRGTLSVTNTGKECQRWSVQTPNAHGYTPDKFPNAGLGAHNYCRNPGNDPTAWCYTTEGVRWEYCDVEEFRCISECYHQANGADYRGTVSVTESGHTCQKWSSQSPQSHGYTIAAHPAGGLGDHNYCRNPSGDPRTWCYTTTPGVRWQYCNVGPAVDVCATEPPPPPTPEPTEAPTIGIVSTVVPTYPPCVFPVDLKDVAQGKTVSQSSTNEKRRGFAEKAVDGNKSSDMKSGQSCTQTQSQPEPWWKVDLGQSYDVYEIIITNRQDCCAGRLKNAEVRVGDSSDFANNPTCGMMIIGSPATEETVHVRCGCSTPMKGQYVSIQIIGKDKPMHLCEVEVMVPA
ncbi:plasminogen-like [Glandiceps talaboti]